MGPVLEVEARDCFREVPENLVVPRHVRCQDAADDALAAAPVYVGAHVPVFFY